MAAIEPQSVHASPAPTSHPLMAIAAARAEVLGPSLAAQAFGLGLAVTLADGDRRPIPIGAIPVILDEAEVGRRAQLATRLVGATAKAARWLMAGAGRDATLAALGPAEQRLVQASWNGPQALAVARVDFLGAGPLQALEVNATIPAMQGYSDIAAACWLSSFAPGRTDLADLVRANGSNADALRQALLDLYAQARGGEPDRIGLLCRRGDAQITELRYLRDRFRAAGLDADVVHPDELSWERGWLQHAGRTLPLVYRHLFISRLDASPAPALEAAMSSTARHGTLVLNRPAPHLEMKSTLALLSESVDSPALADGIGLDADELAAIAAAVPWTRRLQPPEDEASRALLAQVAADPEHHVLKRSWSYGGNEVFVGRGHRSPEFLARLQASHPGLRQWAELCGYAARDRRGGGFIVQRAIARSESRQWLCTPDAAREATVTTDYAAYASIGTAPAWSGVCRAATSDVVNIVGGGAVVPVIRREVADRLMAGLSNRAPA